MPCCTILLILFLGPRVAMVAIALFSNYLGRAFAGGILMPLLGMTHSLSFQWAAQLEPGSGFPISQWCP
jgi:hypothetical protein